MKKVILFIGPPGCGKENKIQNLIKSGEYVRISAKQELEKAGYVKYDQVKRVQDKEVIKLLKKRLSELETDNRRIILDGFSRTEEQARLLTQVCNIEKVIYFRALHDVAFARVTGRMVCPKCGAEFSKGYQNHPKKEWQCDYCQKKLIKQEMDLPQTFNLRYRTFELRIDEILNFYASKNIPVKIIQDDLGCMDIFSILNESAK